jgi:hypothetical protein
MYNENAAAIQAVITHYFEGVFSGDTDQLQQAFHPECILQGDINGTPYYKNFTAYIELVRQRKSPQELGESFGMQLLGIEVWGHIAIVRAYLPMLGYRYYDVLSLAKTAGRWQIVHKLFTNLVND